MDSRRLDAALRMADDTQHVAVAAGALQSVDDVFSRCFGQQPAVVVADENTFSAAGRTVHQRLGASGRHVEDPIVFPGAPTLYADFTTVLALEGKLHQYSAIPVAVGAGTINDLTKLAAHRLGRRYMCVATAASVDGYAAFGAAITRDGFKQTVACPAPRAILADLDVVVAAPVEMTSSGYGDLLGKVTAGADWILADAIGAEAIDTRAWSLVQDSLRSWTADPRRLRARDAAAIEHLFEGLIMSGLAMQISQSSRPASGSEHRFSHLWEMQALDQDHSSISHGFKVGIGTLAAAALYERMLVRDLDGLDVDALCQAWPSPAEVELMVRQAHNMPQLAENAVAESLAKYIDREQLRQRLATVRTNWPVIRSRLEAQLMTAAHLRTLLQAAGCPIVPAEIGVSTSQLRASYALARTIRSRYTILDLVHETGLLDACLDEMFGPGGFWSGHAA